MKLKMILFTGKFWFVDGPIINYRLMMVTFDRSASMPLRASGSWCRHVRAEGRKKSWTCLVVHSSCHLHNQIAPHSTITVKVLWRAK